MKSKKKFYITAAIPYTNSAPHLGHALEIIQADSFARFNRLLGKDVRFQVGTDEHGLKNWETAKKHGKEIMEFLDENVSLFKKLYNGLNISYDGFIRTTDRKNHYPGAIKLWEELVKSGDIYKKKYNGVYCTGCEAFKAERELESGKCPNHPTRELQIIEEENYFFRLSKYSGKVSKIIESDKYKVVPNIRKNEILSFLKIANDISFSRPKASLPWGIPVPDDDSHNMYVWCDALSNYITAIGYGRDEKSFKQFWPADVHVIGKDILRFHAAFWPAMLISAKIPLPKKLFIHGFILSKGTKMGKSTGNIIEPFGQIERYGVDQFRFYILGAMPLESDGEYSEELLKERINNELAGNFGNFCYRVLNFLNKNFNGVIEGIDKNENVIAELNSRIAKTREHYENFNFSLAISEILMISHIGNKYFQDNEPWKLMKDDKKKTHEILGLCANIAKNLAILIEPVMPDFSANLQNQLNVKNLRWEDINFELKNHKIGKDEILVKKIEKKDEQPKFPLDLKVAKILEARGHPNADKLYVLDIDLGSEKRQLVAGIKPYYSPEELKNKKIIVVANLKYAKLRGVESQGMLLAGDDGNGPGLLAVEQSNPGDKVYFEGFENKTEQAAYEEFAKIGMIVKNGRVYFEGKELKTEKEIVKVERAKDGARVR
ncbi:methionine--tRNA ligase [Candidatus Woesearchaeota archaeon]|nr:methionine--tRNA ligase [Candidatus Woesearchaeota archaeon]